MPLYRELSGQTFGRLTALNNTTEIGKHPKLWNCLCECGRYVLVRNFHLLSGHTKSCGCIRKEKGNALRHGMSQTRTYRIWVHMIQRCHNKNRPRYKDYGGRGIKVCDKWRESFDCFFADMGECPENQTIDRINNNGDYCKKNCKWSTYKEQMTNKRKRRS
ncbi:MAG: hypothetical protein AB7Q04_13325 [Steroidobacteraceae bacterium]